MSTNKYKIISSFGFRCRLEVLSKKKTTQTTRSIAYFFIKDPDDEET